MSGGSPSANSHPEKHHFSLYFRMASKCLAGSDHHPVMTGAGGRTGGRVVNPPAVVDEVPIFRLTIAFNE